MKCNESRFIVDNGAAKTIIFLHLLSGLPNMPPSSDYAPPDKCGHGRPLEETVHTIVVFCAAPKAFGACVAPLSCHRSAIFGPPIHPIMDILLHRLHKIQQAQGQNEGTLQP